MALTNVRCPTCRRSTEWADNPFRPFCSQRCKLADLGQWASESYRLPGPTLESEAENAAPAGDPGNEGKR